MQDTRFIELLDAFASKRVAVVGDFILDEYLVGETKRVSREAPVVVIDYLESLYHPGGAANAAQNVCALSAKAMAIGLVGRDMHGQKLTEVLSENDVETDGLIADADVLTAVKTRILAGELHAQKQQVARIDRSRTVSPSSAASQGIRERLSGAAMECDAVLISDYGMGLVPGVLSDDLIGRCQKQGIPVVVDSRFRLAEFRGATVATPNEVELFDGMQATPEQRANLDMLAERLVVESDMQALIVTRGSKGMRVVSRDQKQSVGIVGSRDVTDVTGAGDTVAATVALSLSAGATVIEAAEMATYAAAVVVMKRGTATVTREELTHIRQEYPKPLEPGEANNARSRSRI